MNVPFRVGSTTALSNEHLPSPAQFVLVDNTSNQWLYQPDAQRYIAPYAMNITMPLPLASGANMQVASPPGVTQAAPIAGQQYLAVFSDTEPSGLPYTSQTNVEITNGTVDATITGGTMDVTATVAGGTLDANITNATLDATITNATIDINNVTPDIGLMPVVVNPSLTSGSTTAIITLAANIYIRGLSISGSAGGLVGLYHGPAGAPGTEFWQGIIQASMPETFVFPPGTGIAVGSNTTIWIFVQTGGEYSVTLYYN